VFIAGSMKRIAAKRVSLACRLDKTPYLAQQNSKNVGL